MEHPQRREHHLRNWPSLGRPWAFRIFDSPLSDSVHFIRSTEQCPNLADSALKSLTGAQIRTFLESRLKSPSANEDLSLRSTPRY